MSDLTDPATWGPERIGTTAFLLTLLTLVVRGALKRTWVPWSYFAEMKAERDKAMAEAKQANDTSASLAKSLAEAMATIGQLSGRAA